MMIRVRLHIKQIATDQNITRAKLSRIADISPGTLERIWKDPYHEAYLSTIARIAIALQVPVERLYSIEEDRRRYGDGE